MGISEEAIRARAAVPEQFRPTDNAILARGFAESSLQTEDITIIDENGNEVVLDGAITKAERRNAAVTAQGRADDQEFEALRAGTSNRIDATGLSQKERDDARARSRENANADARMQALMALQAQLDALSDQIWNLEDALAYLDRTGDVEGTMEKPGVLEAIEAWETRTGQTFDRNDPNAMAILKGIIEDDIKAKKALKAEAEQEVKLLNDEVDQKRELEEARDAKLAVINQTYEGRSETIDGDVREERMEATKEARNAASRTKDLEERLVELIGKNGSGHTDEINLLLSDAEQDVLSEVANDPEKYPELSTRFALAALKEQLSYLDGYKGTPEYQQFVEIALGTVSDKVVEALRNEPDLDDELVAVLYEPYSDELEAKGKTEPQREPENEATKVATVIPSGNHPGMG